MKSSFDLHSAQAAAKEGKTHEWVQDYLRSGTWVNLGLADGLLLAPRLWLGPFEVPLDAFSRNCGPEPEMEYPEPVEVWNSRVEAMAASIVSLDAMPPLMAAYRE